MKRQTKFTSEQQQQHAAEEQSQNQQAAREFATPEEALRFDAAQTVVPPTIAQRLRQSAESLTPPSRSWWKKFFGGTNP